MEYSIIGVCLDPVPALEYAQTLQRRAEKVSDLEVENQKLRETLGRTKKRLFDIYFIQFNINRRI